MSYDKPPPYSSLSPPPDMHPPPPHSMSQPQLQPMAPPYSSPEPQFQRVHGMHPPPPQYMGQPPLQPMIPPYSSPELQFQTAHGMHPPPPQRMSQPCQTAHGFYWRDYTGFIPGDAFQANDDSFNPIYIGQAYLPGGGLIPGEINPGESEMVVGYNGPKNVTSHIKILCGSPENFMWIAANKQNFKKRTAGRRVLIAGYDIDHAGGSGNIGVGRVSYEGVDRVGKINLWPEAGRNVYQITQVVGGNVTRTKYFEEFDVLIYKNK